MARIYAKGDVPAVAMAVGTPIGIALGLAWGEPAFMGVGAAIGAGVGLAIGAAIEANLSRKERVRPLTAEEKRQRWRFGLAGVAAGTILLAAMVVLYLTRN